MVVSGPVAAAITPSVSPAIAVIGIVTTPIPGIVIPWTVVVAIVIWISVSIIHTAPSPSKAYRDGWAPSTIYAGTAAKAVVIIIVGCVITIVIIKTRIGTVETLDPGRVFIVIVIFRTKFVLITDITLGVLR
jgi:hypothetical protein